MPFPCHQCGRPAMYEVGAPGNRILLCLDCYVKITRVQTAQLEALQHQISSTEAMMYEVSGLPLPPRLMPPAPQVHTGPMNVSSFNIRDSSIGVLNTGNLSIVSSCISVLAKRGEKELSKAISELSAAVILEAKLTEGAKNEILELISAISEESIKPKERRRPGVLKAYVSSLAASIGTIAGLITIWDKVRPLFESLMLP